MHHSVLLFYHKYVICSVSHFSVSSNFTLLASEDDDELSDESDAAEEVLLPLPVGFLKSAK